MSRHGERKAAPFWIEGSEPQLFPLPWQRTSVKVHEAIGQRLRHSYTEDRAEVPERLQDLLETLNRLPVPDKPEA